MTTYPLSMFPMRAQILSIETTVPDHWVNPESYTKATCDLMGLNRVQSQFVHRITTKSQIDRRYVTVKDFSAKEAEGDFFRKNEALPFPCTQKRNALYKQEAPKLAAQACNATLKAWGGKREAITHVISVSCTGMVAPGIEFSLIGLLGLSSTVARLGINFMGCFGAFKGLAIAQALAMENPKHRILVVCTELCSLHFQGDFKPDTLIANALFADGAAAAIVGCRPQAGESPLFELHEQASEALEATAELMSWEVGNFGYQMRLSAEVPHYLETHIGRFVNRLIGSKHSYDQMTWAVHPGGAAILDSIGKVFSLQRHQMKASWTILRNYGNMSSPTFLFVLKELLRHHSVTPWVIGLGFGPGLSIEGRLLKRMDSYVAK